MTSISNIEAATKVLGTYTDPIPPDLLHALCAHRVIAFVGAGTSMRCLARNRRPLPGWKDFLSELVAWAGSNRFLDADATTELSTLVAKNEFLLVAEECKERLGDNVLAKFVYETFEPDGITPTVLHELLMVVPFAGYITTNYDNLLERAYGKVFNKQMPSATLASFAKDMQTDPVKRPLLKLHGDIEHPKSIVLAHRDYLRMIWDKKQSRPIRDLLSNYTFLFIGSSLSDLDILLALDEIAFSGKGRKHFLLAQRGTRGRIERERLAKDRNVTVIEYYDAFGHHNHIDTFLRGLAHASGSADLLGRVRPSLWRRISVHSLATSEEDGRFVRRYLFREGAIVDSREELIARPEHLRERTNDRFEATDYVVFVSKQHELDDPSVQPDLEAACAVAIEAGVHIVFLVVGATTRPRFLTSTRGVLPTFLLRDNFSEVDLSPVRQYLEQDARGGFKQR
jgi:hypothetical protein